MTAASAECLAGIEDRRRQLRAAAGVAAVMPGFGFECGHEKSLKSSVVSPIVSPCYPLRGFGRMAPHGPGRIQLPKPAAVGATTAGIDDGVLHTLVDATWAYSATLAG